MRPVSDKASRRSMLLCCVLVLTATTSLRAGLVTSFTPTWRGSVNRREFRSGGDPNSINYTPTTADYVASFSNRAKFGGYRNFFVFDVSNLNGAWITNGSLELKRAKYSGSGLSMTFRDFSENSVNDNLDAYYDANDGITLATGSLGGYLWNDILSFELNSDGIAHANETILPWGKNWFGLGGVLSGRSLWGSAFNFTPLYGDTKSSDSKLRLEYVRNNAPVAHSVDKSIVLGEGVTLDGSGSYDDDAVYGDTVVRYFWDLNADFTYEFITTNPTLSLSSSQLASRGLGVGSHSVRLLVRDRWRTAGSTTSTLTIHAASVPEPSTLTTMFFLGVIGVGYGRRRKRKGD